tara:strand:- start:78672 stop:78782 length:111 start_codon:yes stop_codon:yes gene_type:complete
MRSSNAPEYQIPEENKFAPFFCPLFLKKVRMQIVFN